MFATSLLTDFSHVLERKWYSSMPWARGHQSNTVQTPFGDLEFLVHLTCVFTSTDGCSVFCLLLLMCDFSVSGLKDAEVRQRFWFKAGVLTSCFDTDEQFTTDWCQTQAVWRGCEVRCIMEPTSQCASLFKPAAVLCYWRERKCHDWLADAHVQYWFKWGTRALT